jgi:hypothetical protein
MRNNRRTATSIFVVLSVRFSDLDIALFSEDKRPAELQLLYPEKKREIMLLRPEYGDSESTISHDFPEEVTRRNVNHSVVYSFRLKNSLYNAEDCYSLLLSNSRYF